MPAPRLVVGRYLLYEIVGGGGMAEVYAGRLVGAAGFSRVVAIKRIHPALVDAPDMTTLLVDEARVASRIRHPNVIPILDVVDDKELLVVMEYVHGLSLSQLGRLAEARRSTVPTAIAVRLVLDALAGLHAAHEARSERGTWLGIVHRDVSPQNVLVGADGIARLLDFGIAKAFGKAALTREGQVRGKLGYMAPEQLRAGDVDRRTDVYAAGVVLWELLTGRRLYIPTAEGVLEAIAEVEALVAPPPSQFADVAPALDAVVVRATRREPGARFASAEEMAAALEAATPAARPREVAAFVASVAGEWLDARDALIAEIEQRSVSLGSDGRAAAHVTNVPWTAPVASGVPSTEPTTRAPTTEVPVTKVPTTEGPATKVPTTEVPATKVPTTEVPTTEPSALATATLSAPLPPPPPITAPLARERPAAPSATGAAVTNASQGAASSVAPAGTGPRLAPEGSASVAPSPPAASSRPWLVLLVVVLAAVAVALVLVTLREERRRAVGRAGRPPPSAIESGSRPPRGGRR